MKIAIQGHPTRGKDVIKIFESLGGINKSFFNGRNPYAYYYIDENNFIDKEHVNDIDTQQYKFYTLTEFEKEFPFKVGDKVVFKKDYGILTAIHTITGFEFYRDEFCYLLDYVDYLHYSATKLKLYQPMKEERNVTLTLDKAKEWYNKGGELKEIALQAFTKEELNPLPKSWDEYCKTYRIPTTIFGPCAPIKYIALWKLEQLRDCYRQGWKPKSKKEAYVIKHADRGLSVYCYHSQEFLSFQPKEVAEEFLKNFEPLIKEAGDLI